MNKNEEGKRTAFVYYNRTCPACGHNENMNITQIQKRTKDVFDSFSKIIQFQIKQVASIIEGALPSERNLNTKYRFMVHIRECRDEAIFKKIDEFVKTSKANEGKGYMYLAAMIKKYEENIDKVKEMERKRFGRIAPYVDLEAEINEVK